MEIVEKFVGVTFSLMGDDGEECFVGVDSFKYLGHVLQQMIWTGQRFARTLGGQEKFGALGEVADEGGSRTNSLSKVLTSGGPGSAPRWGGNLGLDDNYGAKTGGGTRGCLAAGGGDVSSKAGGLHVSKVGVGEGDTGNRDKASSGIY